MRNYWIAVAFLAVMALCLRPVLSGAQDPTPAPAPATAAPASPAPPTPAPAEVAPSPAAAEEPTAPPHWHRDNARVAIGHDSRLEKGESADAVVSVFGSSTSEGEVSQAVVSVFGDTRVTGPVGESAVSVFGDVYVDSRVGEAVVAVLGNIELGPNADVADAVSILGSVRRAPGAVIRGTTNEVFGAMGGLRWLRPWIRNCFVYGRPLAMAPGLEWAWALALSFLALYVLLAVAFRDAVDACIHTLEAHPGRTLLASLLAVVFTPLLMVLLVVTVIGIVGVPFVLGGLFCAALFGKAVVLGWIGGRCLKVLPSDSPPPHTALAVLIGGVLVLGLYMLPLVGAIVFNLLGAIAVGVVLYTLILHARESRQARAAASAPASAAAAGWGAAAGAAGAAAAASPHLGEPAPASPPPEATAPPTAPAAAPMSAGEAASLARAGFWIRMAALVLDAILIGVVLGFLEHSHRLELLALATYAAVMWKLKGTTIGGIVCNLKVVRVDGRSLDWPTAIVRALSCFLSLAALGLGFIWIAFDDEHQGWHDKIAGTIVVRVPHGVSLV